MAAGSRQDVAKLVVLALIGNAGIAAATFASALATGSSALLASAVQSLIDASNQALLLFGLKRSEVPGSKNQLAFWSFVVGILMFSMGAGVSLYEGAARLARPAPLQQPETGYLVLGAALLGQIALAAFVLRQFEPERGDRPLLTALRASRDPSIFTVLIETVAALAGLVVALAGMAASDLGGMPQADGWAAIVIGLILGLVAAFFAIEVKGLLTGDGLYTAVHARVVYRSQKMKFDQTPFYTGLAHAGHEGGDFILVPTATAGR